MKFIGRKEEIAAINNIIGKKGYQGCLIYGRRRMGKTELIKHCLSDKPVPLIMYQCKETSEQENTTSLTELIKKTLSIGYLHFNHFMDAVEYLFEYGVEKDIYFVIDEYPYLRDTLPGCDSKLQAIIDKYCTSSNIKFFILGSSISSMSSLLEGTNPLYMRLTLSILLKQMDYYDAKEFYPSYSNEDKIRLYAAFGGVPFYNAQIDESLSAKQNIINLISGRFSGLQDFLKIYLKSEIRKVNSANAVFENIALGAFHFSDIMQKSHIDSSPALSAILNKLIEMDLIDYIAPINDKKNKRKAGYRISDPSISFYYNFIYRNESAHEILDDSAFYDMFIDKEFESVVVPHTFELIAKQFLIRENKKGRINPLLMDIGTYWYDDQEKGKNGQFDVVGKNKDGYVFFECKYTNEKINDALIKEEIRQVEQTDLTPAQYGFFSKNGFSLNNKYPYLFYSLEDMYR